MEADLGPLFANYQQDTDHFLARNLLGVNGCVL